MGDEPFGVFFGNVFDAGLVDVDVELRRIHRFDSGVNEIVESEVQESFQVSAVFDICGIIVL